MKKVLITFGYPEAILLKICRAAIKKMTGNVNFPDANPTTVVMEAKADAFQQAMSAADTGDKDAIAHKNALKADLALSMRGWAIYVNMVSNGNTEKLVSSGLPLAKLPQPVVLYAPKNILVEQALNPKSLAVSFDRVKGAKGYIYQWALAPVTKETQWFVKGSGLKSMVIENLLEGEKYVFKITAFGPREEEAISNEVTQYVVPRS